MCRKYQLDPFEVKKKVTIIPIFRKTLYIKEIIHKQLRSINLIHDWSWFVLEVDMLAA